MKYEIKTNGSTGEREKTNGSRIYKNDIQFKINGSKGGGNKTNGTRNCQNAIK